MRGVNISPGRDEIQVMFSDISGDELRHQDEQLTREHWAYLLIDDEEGAQMARACCSSYPTSLAALEGKNRREHEVATGKLYVNEPLRP